MYSLSIATFGYSEPTSPESIATFGYILESQESSDGRHYPAVRQFNGPFDMILGENYKAHLKVRYKQLDYVDELAQNLMLEVFPDTAIGLLPFWEQLTGLDKGNKSIDERRKAIISVLRTVGKGNRITFETIASSLGYVVLQYPNVSASTVTIVEGSEFKGFRAGFSRAGDRVYSETSIQNEHTIIVYGTLASQDEQLKQLFENNRFVGINFIYIPV
jgi:uncharacterized protein YmfQ (DUF2313 family)